MAREALAILAFGTCLCVNQSDPFVEAGKNWELLGEGFQLTADSAVDKSGHLYFTDARRNRIYRIDLQGNIALWKEDSGGAHGITIGPGDRMYVGQHDQKRIIAYAPDGSESVVAEGVQTHHLTATRANAVYFAEAPTHRVWFVDSNRHKRVVSTDIDWPRSVRVSPDQSRLVVNDPHSPWVYAFRIEPDGSLTKREPFCRLQTPGDSQENDPGGMAFDTDGFLYIATPRGVQVCHDGRGVIAIIRAPEAAASGLASVSFGGRNMQWLYVTDGNRMWRRQATRRGAVPWETTAARFSEARAEYARLP